METNAKQQKLSLGFIGGSRDSAVGYAHEIASQMDGRWKLEAGCFSQDQDANESTAMQWGVMSDRVYPDYLSLLDNEQDKLDAVVILTPTPDHADMVIDALERGYAVICEKALTDSSASAKRIAKVVEAHNGFLAVTLNYSGYPMLRELKAQIKAGRLGSINQIQIEMPQEGFARLDAEGNKPKPQEWRLHDGAIPTISLDLGVHLHHLVHYLTGERPEEVVADHSSFGWFEDVIDNVSCIAKFTNSLRCQMWYSKSALGHRNGLRVRLFGDKGSAEWFQMQPEELCVFDVSGRREVLDRASEVEEAGELKYNRFKPGHPAGFIEAFANLYNDIADAYVSFKTNNSFESSEVFGVEHSQEGLRLMEAIAKSADEHRWVKMKELEK